MVQCISKPGACWTVRCSCLSLQWTLAKVQDSQSLGLCSFPQENVCHVGMSEDWVLISKQEKSSVVSAGRHGTTK